MWRFRTGVAAPALLSPANGATNVSTTPLLEWAPVPGATSYQVQVSRGALFNPGQIIFDQANLTTPQWQVAGAGLTVGQRAYWRARASLGIEAGYWAAPRSFIPSFVTAVEAERTAALALAPVVPNPVGAAGAGLTFTLAAPGAVQLSVLDALGRVVARPLASAWLPAGEHRVALVPGRLAAGSYLLRLEAGGEQRTRRLVVE